MKKLILAACIGAFTLGTVGTVMAQEPAKKTTTKKATAKKSKAAPAAETASTPTGEKWQCELGNVLYISGNMLRDEVLTVHWQGRDYKLPRQSTVTGADRYFDARSGLDLVVIPSKAMLFNKNLGQRLADECQNAEMQAGGAAPTQAGGLRAPVASPLLATPQQQPQSDATQQSAAPKQ
ncbi:MULTISPECIES: hypothetical protein [Cupriavidus]|uniref:Probable signal peptide protein n=1 Tax=Cupriavidus pinatubonensis (strain JMP 134 / LMG 1197) TaxID=264198 RepID=Q46YU1_CUPPJ|nr:MULTISPECIES: hypothetical protein [Cupriavidus]QYY30612.1 hypothetical protein K2O51_25105 [Cupriavidus pinatubonensis]TPQ31854.1 hypothetical protein C2U69_27870 [Cupriavidus pinatubonensis]